jgi:outer membrane protein assembly factor BamB
MKTIRITNWICLFFLLISAAAYSQKKGLQVLSKEIILGKNLVDDSDIKGVEFIFPERIHEVFLDTATHFLTVQLRRIKNDKWLNNPGNVLQYDMKNGQLLWNKKIKYQTSNLQQFSKTMIYTVNDNSYRLDINTGKILWQASNITSFLDPVNNIGIGYSSIGYANLLEGIDLKDGSTIWNRKLSREYGWNDMFYLNDSTIIVVAAGLHTINVNNGKGWDYNTATGKKDYTKMIATNAAGIVTGLLTGTFVTATGYDLIRNLVSNTLVDSSFIYFASKEQIVKIDRQSGNIVWKHPFPNDIVSQSSLFMDDNVIYMINKGLAVMNYRQLNYGEPFIAAFDSETGQQKYFSSIADKKEPILSFQLFNDEIYLVFKNKIAKYDKETGNRIVEKIVSKDDFGELKYFVGNQVFITNQNDKLLSLSQMDSTKVFVYTHHKKIISMDEQLNETDIIESDNINNCYLRTKDYTFIAKGEKTLIINNEGEKIAEIEASPNAFMIENVLYDTQNKRFVAIDLKEIRTVNEKVTA